jgi:hypothetical protein
VIRRTKRGYQVRSEGGRNLSADDLTREEAEQRLAQVEAFKTWAKKRERGTRK